MSRSTMLEHLELGPLLGHGGMGRVYAATHRETGASLAVKLLARGAPAASRAALEREVHTLARLDHPHVARVYDVGVVDGGPFLVMQRAACSLADAPPQGWPAAAGVLRAVLEALAHAHARGVVHRDVKPPNVLFLAAAAPPVGVCLADFGMAWTREAAGGHGGSPPYMAPEQLAGRDHGPWTDLYAVGCLAWELVTGEPPFGRGPDVDVLRAHLSAALPELRPRMPVPAGLAGWLEQLLRRPPSLRFQRAADALWALDRLGEPDGDAGGGVALCVAPTATYGATMELAWGEVDLEASGEPPPPAPFPATRRREDRPLDRREEGLGLSLFSLRDGAIVGRQRERDLLWAALAEAHAGARVVVCLEGPPGVGKTRLARWIAEEAHELGAADVLEPGDPPGRRAAVVLATDPDAVVARERVLVVVEAHEPRAVPAGARRLQLEPLDTVGTSRLVQDLLELAPGLAATVEARCAGVPGLAIDMVRTWVEQDVLVRTPDGFAPRPGVSLDTPRSGPSWTSVDEPLAVAHAELDAERPRHALRWLARARLAARFMPRTDRRWSELDAVEVVAMGELGQSARAEALAEEAWPRAVARGAHHAIAMLAEFGARLARFRGDLDEAAHGFRRARDAWERVGEASRAATNTVFLAQLAQIQSRPAEVEQLLDEAEQAFDALGDRWGKALTLRRRAILVHDLGDSQRALELCSQALDELGPGWLALRASVHVSQGHALLALDRPGDATAAFEQALALFEACGNVEALLARVNLAVCDLHRAEWARARARLERARQHMERVAGGTPMLALLSGLLLPCLAAAGEWEAFDRRLEEARGHSVGSADLARWAERAADLCPPERAREVLAFARSHFERVRRPEDAARVAARLQV